MDLMTSDRCPIETYTADQECPTVKYERVVKTRYLINLVKIRLEHDNYQMMKDDINIVKTSW